MAKKYQIAENRVTDIDAIYDADFEEINGVFTLTYRVIGSAQAYRMVGPLAKKLWSVLLAEAAPVYDLPAPAEAA